MIEGSFESDYSVPEFSGAPLVLSNSAGDVIGVWRAGNPSLSYLNNRSNGIEIAGVQGRGLYVGRADLNAIRVQSAGGSGINITRVHSAAGGLMVDTVPSHGIVVGRADNLGLYLGETGSHGILS